jgi:hypothetical protein
VKRCATAADSKKQIADSGGVHALVDVMRMHERDAALQDAAGSALRNFAFGNSKLLSQQPVLTCRLNPTHATPNRVRACVCAAINKDSIPNAGGITALIRALQLHRSDATVVESCAGALRNISSNNSAWHAVQWCRVVTAFIRMTTVLY